MKKLIKQSFEQALPAFIKSGLTKVKAFFWGHPSRGPLCRGYLVFGTIGLGLIIWPLVSIALLGIEIKQPFVGLVYTMVQAMFGSMVAAFILTVTNLISGVPNRHRLYGAGFMGASLLILIVPPFLGFNPDVLQLFTAVIFSTISLYPFLGKKVEWKKSIRRERGKVLGQVLATLGFLGITFLVFFDVFMPRIFLYLSFISAAYLGNLCLYLFKEPA